MFSRRSFLSMSAAAGAALCLPNFPLSAATTAVRRFHVCLEPRLINKNPALLEVVHNAGVSDIWMAAYFYGHWGVSLDQLREAAKLVSATGMHWHLINVPLGHPGDALGDSTGETPISPPGSWANAQRPDGSYYSGTSLHPPATKENAAAIKALAALKPNLLFLDDDFRLATGPGVIGGCFCPKHQEDFLKQAGLAKERWPELLGDVKERRLSPLLRTWVDYTCDALTASFRAQQAANPDCALGNMIMYLGAEKAGIRLRDYAQAPFRVGEMMFNDKSFGNVKAKTDELFSALFHRRYAQPELAYSETTAYPADQLSAANMAAKLAVSTITDVRHTMYMSGLTPFPQTHWEVLAPAMAKNAALHERLKGHRPQGPLKHYWGEASRYVGDDRPFSLFLGSGLPFEVIDSLPSQGHVFLSDQDAQYLPQKTADAMPGKVFCRPGQEGKKKLAPLEESLEAMWAFKAKLVQEGVDFPYVVEEAPVVCAWYPSAKAVLLWNLSEEKQELHIQHSAKTIFITLGALDIGLVDV